jgi:hypothetical protein
LDIAGERTSEANILCDISQIIKLQSKTNVTIISPLTLERKQRVSDNLIQLSLNGQTIIFQFMKPYSYPSGRNNNYTKFIIQTEQHGKLLQCFKPKQVFYIFEALSNVYEIISNRNDLIKYCIALDIHEIPEDVILDQRTRVVRMVKSSLTPKLEITNKRKFVDISNLMTIDEVCSQFIKGIAGITIVPGLVLPEASIENIKEWTISQHTYIFHLNSDSSAAS